MTISVEDCPPIGDSSSGKEEADGVTDAEEILNFQTHLNGILEETDHWKEWEGKHSSKNLEEAKRVAQEILNDEKNLLRILIARKRKFDASSKLFVEQVTWRSKWRPHEVDKDMIPHALDSGAWRLCGYSKEGCIISNYKLKFWKPSEYGEAPKKKPASYSSYLPGSGYFSGSTDTKEPVEKDEAVDEYVRYVAYMCELMIGKMRDLPVPQQFVILFDLEGFSSDMVLSKRSRMMISRLVYVAQAQYPERLRKVYLINAPYGFSTAWKLIKSILDEKTASKIKFVSGDLSEAMSEDVDKGTLSVAYSGDHAEYSTPSMSLVDELQLNVD